MPVEIYFFFTVNHIKGVIKVMDWPPQSPDLNIIESAWDLLDRRVRELGRPSSEKHMWELLQAGWASITKEDIEKLIKSMKKRCEAVILAKGGHTRY